MKCYVTVFEGLPSFGQLETQVFSVCTACVNLHKLLLPCISSRNQVYEDLKTRQFCGFVSLADNYLLVFIAITHAAVKFVWIFFSATCQCTKKIRWHLFLVFKSSILQ